MACSIKYVKAENIKKAEKQFNSETRRLKQGIKKLSKWIEEAQTEFNAFIRERDKDLPCISCGRVEVEWTRGGSWDCGHYKTRGAYPELRFDERNAAKQCKKCNGGSGKYSRKDRSVKEGFDIGMRERYGQERLDWLNGPHEPKRYTVKDLKVIQRWYKRKTKRLENENT